MNGDFEEAALELVEVLEIQERVLGADHPDTVQSRALLDSIEKELSD